MKRCLILLCILISLCCKAFSYNKSVVTSLALDLDYHVNEEIRHNVFPLLPGLFISYDSFQPGSVLGLHIDTTFFFLAAKSDGNSSNGIAFSFAGSVGPSLKIGGKTHLLISPCITAGLKFADFWPDGNAIPKPRIYSASLFLFQCFLGVGGDVILAINQGLCFGANFYYYPLCFSVIDVDNTTKRFPKGAMYRGGLFLGVMVEG